MENEGWIKWKSFSELDKERDTSWLLNFRVKAFKLLLVISIFFLLLIVIRSFWSGRFGYVDLGNALFFIIIFILLHLKPKLFKLLAWLGLVALIINTFEGFRPFSAEVIVPSFILYPLLVLYGALLGDIWITLAASSVILLIFSYSWFRHSPLPEEEFISLTNLCLLVAGTGVSAIAVLLLHQRLLRVVQKQALDLHRELQNKFRLNALIFHDIINPLGIIDGTIDLINDKKKADPKDLKTLENMVGQIQSIIDSARGMESGLQVDMDEISVYKLFEELKKLFAIKLENKELLFCYEGEKDFKIFSSFQILLNSILGNIVANAIKFSPRGGKIHMTVCKEKSMTRVVIRDEGDGFPKELLECAESGEKYYSRNGTEGEVGTAFGLMIAAMCLQNIGGSLELKNCGESQKGAAVSIVIPERK